jgi:hypothetical protein
MYQELTSRIKNESRVQGVPERQAHERCTTRKMVIGGALSTMVHPEPLLEHLSAAVLN